MADENHEAITKMLGAAADVAMPDWVTDRIDATLRGEVAHRATTGAADEAKQSWLQMQASSDLGTWGENAPAHYDPSGVGIEVTRPARG